MKKFRVSCIQTNSQSDPENNIRHIKPLIKKAINNNSDLICLPECAVIFSDSLEKLMNFNDKKKHFISFFKDISKKNKVFILLGSIPFKNSNKKFFNRSIVINPKGEIISKYDKINLFDVVLDKKENYLESKLYDPGKKIINTELPWGKLGLSICYDLRFPYLYKKLAQKGSDFFSIPAAFTKTTGEAHWYSLIRTRAIENGCFVFAPAQCGNHDNGRETYGHSMIVDPWGKVLAEAKNKPTIITAEIDKFMISVSRKKIPSMTNYGF